MPSYRGNKAGVGRARKLIEDGDWDDKTEWSDDAPSTDEQNTFIDKHSLEEFEEWHLALDEDAGEDTKGRYRFPYGDFKKVNRAGLIHAKQRASQNNHDEIEKAADDLLERLDKKRS